MSSQIEAPSHPLEKNPKITHKHTYTTNSKFRQNAKMDKKPQKNMKIKSYNFWQYVFLEGYNIELNDTILHVVQSIPETTCDIHTLFGVKKLSRT